MGQPITVVEKPSPRPGLARFEINRSLTGMGHERYTSVDDILDDRPVDELARRLFATGTVESLHVNSSMITVILVAGARGDAVAEVIRGLYIYYPLDPAEPSANGAGRHDDPPTAEPAGGVADVTGDATS